MDTTRGKGTTAMKRPAAASVSAYIAAQPRAAQASLRRVRGAIQKALPRAEEVISYGIPAYRVEGRAVVYFAGFKQHYSLYPAGPRIVAAFQKELAPYEYNGRGTIRFPLSEPVPERLVERLAAFMAKEAAERIRARAGAAKKR
jgi:uncharacterized protein YdhG (YjbR/CyaY superfamily)